MRSISEILKSVAEKKDFLTRMEALREAAKHQAVARVLQLAYDPSIVFNLPEGDPPYKPCQYLDQQSMLYSQLRKMYLFIGEGNPGLSNLKKEALFIGMLEALDPEDAKLVLAIKSKKLPYPELTQDLVHAARPDLCPPLPPNGPPKKKEGITIQEAVRRMRNEHARRSKTKKKLAQAMAAAEAQAAAAAETADQATQPEEIISDDE